MYVCICICMNSAFFRGNACGVRADASALKAGRELSIFYPQSLNVKVRMFLELCAARETLARPPGLLLATGFDPLPPRVPILPPSHS